MSISLSLSPIHQLLIFLLLATKSRISIVPEELREALQKISSREEGMRIAQLEFNRTSKLCINNHDVHVILGIKSMSCMV